MILTFFYETHINKKYGENNLKSKTFLIQKPSGEVIEIKGLKQFCKNENLSYDALQLTRKKENYFYRGGWKILKKLD